MDNELIERLAGEAGIYIESTDEGGMEIFGKSEGLIKFAALVAEECAKIAESDYLAMLATQTAHYRLSSTPFDQSRFGFQPDVIGAGRRSADIIRAKFHAPANTPKK